MNNTDRKILTLLQEGIPITKRPYKDIAYMLGIPEDEIISRAKRLRYTGLIKRVGFSINLKKMGFVSTLVGCKIPIREIPRAKDIIMDYNNITHNYLRKHELNMWFTINAPSSATLGRMLTKLKKKLNANKVLSLKTLRIFKRDFRLNV